MAAIVAQQMAVGFPDNLEVAQLYEGTLRELGKMRKRDPILRRVFGRGIKQYARRDWEQYHPNSPWDNVKDAVRHAWDSATGQNR